MKIDQPKEWYQRSAEIEGESEVGAGALPPVAGSVFEPYDENKIEHNDAPPLGLSDWQRFDDPTGSESTSFERELEDDEKHHPQNVTGEPAADSPKP